jgi:hypothetical protein
VGGGGIDGGGPSAGGSPVSAAILRRGDDCGLEITIVHCRLRQAWGNLLDDFRLGYNTGKRPDVIVIDESWNDRIGMLRELYPQIFEHTVQVLAAYREV